MMQRSVFSLMRLLSLYRGSCGSSALAFVSSLAKTGLYRYAEDMNNKGK